ncbi:MAG TPA: alkaline phosphatase family protein [Anaerolineales bacterium]|nr:alkaline phosphatase family protein [Anaerolineales bacterium]
MPPVVFIMLDGVRPDALTTANCPTLNSLHGRGASTMQARSVMPSITLPCHTSIFHSVPPTRHGISSNTFVPMARPLPGLVEVARAAGKRVAFFYNWEQLRDLARPGNIHYSYFRDSAYQPDGDDETVLEATRFIQKDKPDFAFIYIGTVDTVGHDYGWMSDEYLNQLNHIDSLLGDFFASLPADYASIIHSDHGGHDRNHGTGSDEDMLIPWMAAGPGIKKGYTIQSPVSLLDTAPTIVRLLDIQPHREWEGRCVEEIFL